MTFRIYTPSLAAFPRTKLSLVIAALLSTVGCTTIQKDVITLKTEASDRIAQETEKHAKPTPVVTRTRGAWLMGEAVPVAAPMPSFLSRKITYDPGTAVSLMDAADYISRKLGITLDTSEVWSTTSGSSTGAQNVGFTSPQMPTAGSTMVPSLSNPIAMGPAVSPMSGFPGAQASGGLARQTFNVKYQGDVKGMLDILASKAGVWWKTADDRGGVRFYSSETKTFYISALMTKHKGSGVINANSNSSGGSSSGSSASSGSGGGITATGGSNSTTDYDTDLWRDLKETAQIVASGGKTATNPSVGSITVTGTPLQIRNVEQWVKSLSENLAQQVAITLDVYTVKLKAEDAYNWNPSVVFNSLSGKYGVTLSGPDVPAITSGANPLNFSVGVLETATGNAAKYSGSKFAYTALSTLGDVAQVMHQTVVTLNGSPAPMQMADVEGYLASSTPSASVAVGATPLPPTLTPGTLTTGFTATFIPRIVNGKIFLAMEMTSSTNNGFGQVGTTSSFIQTPNYSQNTFSQSTRLTPGASLLLTSVQQIGGQSNRSGVGAANNYLFGGGVSGSTNKQLTAIVITAKVL